MKLQDQVCTLEQAKRLRELGVTQDSFQSWFGDEEFRLRDNGNSAEYSQWLFVSGTIPHNNMEADHRADCCLKPIAAAFTVAELGVMLPCYIDKEQKAYILTYRSIDNSSGFYCTDNAVNTNYELFATEAEARAAMLIYLLENNIATVAEVNARLQL